jgi:hypothetical protein
VSLTVAVVGALLTTVQAQKFLQMTTDAAADKARAIVVAKVLHVDVRAVGGADNIFTFVDFRTLQTIKGDEPARFTYRMLGGRLGGTEVSGGVAMPRFAVGDEMVLFLGPEVSSEGYPTLILTHLYRIATSASGLKTVTPPPTGLLLDPSSTSSTVTGAAPTRLEDFLAALRRR